MSTEEVFAFFGNGNFFRNSKIDIKRWKNDQKWWLVDCTVSERLPMNQRFIVLDSFLGVKESNFIVLHSRPVHLSTISSWRWKQLCPSRQITTEPFHAISSSSRCAQHHNRPPRRSATPYLKYLSLTCRIFAWTPLIRGHRLPHCSAPFYAVSCKEPQNRSCRDLETA